MNDIDWYEIKFLESSSNLKELIKKSVGRQPSTKIANEIAVCMQQGRMFFEAASSSPLEIKPLQIFYGIVGFAKAIVLTRNVISIETLTQAHGISDTSEQNARLHQLTLKILRKGIFQHFNDTLSKLGCIYHYGILAAPTQKIKPFDNSSKLFDKEISLKEILARIPYLEHLYEKTFDEPAKILPLHMHYWDEYNGYVDLRIYDPEIFTDRQSLKKLVQKWRAKYLFLEDWCLAEATCQQGNSILIFGNIDKKGINEFSEEFLMENDGHFLAERDLKYNQSYQRRDITEIIQPLAGGLTKSQPYIIDTYDGAYISEFSLHFLGAYLLSSLVRYRPQIWRYAISRSFTHESSADDKALALIERFLDLSLQEFPRMVVNAVAFKN